MEEVEGGGLKQKIFTIRTKNICHGYQVPHLDGPLAVAREDEPPGPGPHPTTPLALVNTEAGDDGTIHRPSDTIMVKLDKKD